MRADIDHDADNGDRRPQAEHRTPVEQPLDAFAEAAGAARLAGCPGFARLVAAAAIGLALRRLLGCFLGSVIAAAGHAIIRREAQIGQRRADPEGRLLAPVLFLAPRHTQTPRHLIPRA